MWDTVDNRNDGRVDRSPPMRAGTNIRRVHGVATLSVALVALSLTVPTTVWAGDVRGVINVDRDFRPSANNTHLARSYSLQAPNGSVPITEASFRAPDEVTIVIVGEAASPPLGCSYGMQGGGFTPTTMVTRVGSQLTLDNRDGLSYELYSPEIDALASAPIAPGSERTIPMPNTPGVHVIRDRVQPHVRGMLHVIPNLVACGQIDDDGDYRFRDVPPGEYSVRVYFQGRVIVETLKLHNGTSI